MKDQTRKFKRRWRGKCIFCSKIFDRSERLDTHLRSHIDERPFNCSQCNISFTSEDYLKKHHRRVHHQPKKRICTTESIISTRLRKKTWNMESTVKTQVTAEQPHNQQKKMLGRTKCDKCRNEFSNLFNMLRHQRLNRCKMFPVRQATLDFKNKSALRKSQSYMSINKKRPLMLQNKDGNIAGIGTGYKRIKRSPSSMGANAIIEKNGPKKCEIAVCFLCRIKFPSRNILKSHMQTAHKNRKIFECIQCPAWFLKRSSLTRHTLREKNGKSDPYSNPEAFLVNEYISRRGRIRKPRIMYSPPSSPTKENDSPGSPIAMPKAGESEANQSKRQQFLGHPKKVIVNIKNAKSTRALQSTPRIPVAAPVNVSVENQERDPEASNSPHPFPSLEAEQGNLRLFLMLERQRQQELNQQRLDTGFFLHMNRYKPDD